MKLVALATLVLARCAEPGAVLLCAQGMARDRIPVRLVWDQATLTLVQTGAVYGRMVRLADRRILCSYERGGRIYVRHSRDEGRTWDAESPVAEYQFGTAANPEMLVLQNGWVMLSFNERPRDGIHPFTIKTSMSKDGGATWEGARLVYQAGINSGTGCWKPAQIQLPSGEIQLFFANEKPYPDTTEQEITMVRSFDHAESRGSPQRISLRAGHRDGMPVPVLLAGGKGIAVTIEDNGMAGRFKSAIVRTPATDNWGQAFVSGENERRWAALQVQLPDSVYAGAPYLRQFPGGETVLSVQSGEGRLNEDTLRNSQMVVYLGNSEARNFHARSVPFPVASEASGLWNALFIKDEGTVTAISGTVINGVRGLWVIDGRLERGAVTERRRQ
jgi:hypothetical protein